MCVKLFSASEGSRPSCLMEAFMGLIHLRAHLYICEKRTSGVIK